LLVHADGTSARLERVPLTDTMIKEHFPQELIRRNPELLPVEELEPTFAPLVTIGWEVDASPAGSIDVLCINPDGRLTVVETKLWRNPQALREVVSQVIDYASQASRWSYEDLDERVVAYNRQYRGDAVSLYETVVTETGEENLEEGHFVDRVTAQLQRGRMLLVVAGDGIRERLEDMRSYLQVAPGLHFSLMLVELQLYRLTEGGDDILVVPQLVARSKEIERAVVTVQAGETPIVQVEMPARVGDMARAPQRARLDVQDVLEALDPVERAFVEDLMADLEPLGVYADPTKRDLMFRLPDPADRGRPATLLGINPRGHVLYEDWLPRQLIDSWGIEEALAVDIAEEYYQSVIGLFPGRQMDMDEEGHGEAWKPHIPISKVQGKGAQFREILKRTVERILMAAQERLSDSE